MKSATLDMRVKLCFNLDYSIINNLSSNIKVGMPKISVRFGLVFAKELKSLRKLYKDSCNPSLLQKFY